jgi:hypothetical protein
MIAKSINNTQLKEAIRIAFMGDNDIYSLYDPSVEVKNVDEIVVDIIKKVDTHPEIVTKGIYEKNQLIGYIIYNRVALISFALNINYRLRKYLREFFALIRKEIKGKFNCFLWSKNVRAIKFLVKNGMDIQTETIYGGNLLTALKLK